MKLFPPLPLHLFWLSLGQISLKGIKEWLELVKTPRGLSSPPQSELGQSEQLGRAVSSWDLSISRDGEPQSLCCASPGQALCWASPTVSTLHEEFFGLIKSENCLDVV